MKPKSVILLMTLLLLSQENLRGGAGSSAVSQGQSQRAISLKYYFSKVIIQLLDGKFVYGLLINIERDALIIRKEKADEKVPFQDIRNVKLETGKNPRDFMFSGMLGALYVGNILFLRAENQPTAYMESDWEAGGLLLWNALLAGAGVGMGFLASLFESGEKTFSFEGDETNRLAEWERMRDFVSGVPRPEKLHLSFQASHVFSSVSKPFCNTVERAGYMPGAGYWYYGDFEDYPEYAESARFFNLLRKCQVTYSIRPNLDIGAAVLFLGEPGISAPDYSSSNYSRYVSERFFSTGYFALATYKPFYKSLPRNIQWRVGCGAGAAQIDYELKLTGNWYYPSYLHRSDSYSIAKTVLGSVFLTQLDIFLIRNLSLGISADYVLLPSERVPAFPDWGIPGQKIRLGNGSIGASLGLHF